jgi:predicted anti-sigma-YlaC factor YlaD
MKECVKIKRLLSRYLDKEAGAGDTALIKAHLEHCSICRQELNELSGIKEFISNKEPKTFPPDYLVCRLREDIAREQGAFDPRLSWLTVVGNLSRRLIPVPVSAVLISLLFLILVSSQPTSGYSIEEHMLSGAQTTTSTALGVILGI